jgi:hypothetical protein
MEPLKLAKRERDFEIFVIVGLLVFGMYHSILYFGHTIVPIADFPGFFEVGRDILSFQMPRRFKRAPVLGMLQYIVSWFVGGPHPPLTAGWLLNAVLHPLNLVLLWLVGKRIVGKSALWIAIVAILNPWVIYLLTDPVVETTLLFFTLLTFYFMFRRSKWCYLFASVTAMVRYEGAALILAAFVMDMIHGRDKRERIWALVYSAAACVPLALWMLATVLTWKTGTGHYLSVLFSEQHAERFTQPVESRTGLVLYMKQLWQVGFVPLLLPFPQAGKGFGQVLLNLSKAAAISGFFFGCAYGLCKKQWKILALLIFFVPYVVVHCAFPYPFQRFQVPIFWIALLISWLGFQSVWKLIDGNARVPPILLLVFQALTAIIAVIWFVSLTVILPETSRISPKSASVPYVAMVLVGFAFAVRVYIYRLRYFLREFSILALLCLIIVSNQYHLARLMGDGKKDQEFKLLAGWFVANTEPGEKMGIFLAGTVQVLAPERAGDIVPLPKADSPEEFVKACYERDIVYVVWASREGLTLGDAGYRGLGLHKNIAMLAKRASTESYQFVDRVGWERGYVHIFRLRSPPGSD